MERKKEREVERREQGEQIESLLEREIDYVSVKGRWCWWSAREGVVAVEEGKRKEGRRWAGVVGS